MTFSLLALSISKRFYLAAEEDTIRLGRVIGQSLEAAAEDTGGPAAIVALGGELGAGKTTLTKGLALGLGVDPGEVVASPSFALVSQYQGSRAPLFHLDVYRLEGEDFLDAGLDEYLHAHGVTVIEWAEKIINHLPEPFLAVWLSYSSQGGRQAVVGSPHPGLAGLVGRVAAGWLA